MIDGLGEKQIHAKDIKEISINEKEAVFNIQITKSNEITSFSFKPFSSAEENSFKAKLLRLLITSMKINIELGTLRSSGYLNFGPIFNSDGEGFYKKTADMLNENLSHFVENIYPPESNRDNHYLIPHLDLLDNLASSLYYDYNNLVGIAYEECHFNILSHFFVDKQKKEYQLCLNGVDNSGFYILYGNEVKRIDYSLVKFIQYDKEDETLYLDVQENEKEVEIIQVQFKFNNLLQKDITYKYILLLELFRLNARGGLLDIKTINNLKSLHFSTDDYFELNQLLVTDSLSLGGKGPFIDLIKKAREIVDLHVHFTMWRGNNI
jgi:hypothetical protein